MRLGCGPTGSLFLPLLRQLNLELCTFLLGCSPILVQVINFSAGIVYISYRASSGVGEIVAGAPVGVLRYLGLQPLDQVFQFHLPPDGSGQLGADLAKFIFEIRELRGRRGLEDTGAA